MNYLMDKGDDYDVVAGDEKYKGDIRMDNNRNRMVQITRLYRKEYYVKPLKKTIYDNGTVIYRPDDFDDTKHGYYIIERDLSAYRQTDAVNKSFY